MQFASHLKRLKAREWGENGIPADLREVTAAKARAISKAKLKEQKNLYEEI